MTKIIAVAATMSEPDHPFTLSQLKQLAKTSIDVPILLEFMTSNKVGFVKSAVVTNLGLEVSGELSVNPIGYYLVPGFKLPSYEVMSYGLTRKPKDKALTGIRQI